MNPLLDFEKEKGPGGVFHGLPEGSPEPDPSKAVIGAASSMGGLLAGMRETAPGSLRRAWESSVLRDKLQEGLSTAAYYAGPHISNRVEAVAGLIPAITPKFGTEDARAAKEAFEAGKTGRAAGLMGLGVAGGLLDALPGPPIARGLLKGITKAAHFTPDLSTPAPAQNAAEQDEILRSLGRR